MWNYSKGFMKFKPADGYQWFRWKPTLDKQQNGLYATILLVWFHSIRKSCIGPKKDVFVSPLLLDGLSFGWHQKYLGLSQPKCPFCFCRKLHPELQPQNRKNHWKKNMTTTVEGHKAECNLDQDDKMACTRV